MVRTKVPREQILKDSILQTFSPNYIEKIVGSSEDEPFEILGPHCLPEENSIVINAFLPRAKKAWVERKGKKSSKKEMNRIHDHGFFQAVFPGESKIFSYQLGFQDDAGFSSEFEDPYAFKTEISDFDLYLLEQGTHFESYEKFGANLKEFHGVSGVHFSVWAPNAKSVSLIGNFNHWVREAHPMMRIHFSGVWGLFVPGLKEGEVYKYAIRSKSDNQVYVKADPYAFQAELRPHTASVVATLGGFLWKDQEWMRQRTETDPLSKPMSVYEVHLGSWKREEKNNWGFMNYRELAHQLVDYVKEMGYTHVEFLPITEHPLDESWGYQVVSYYAPTSRFGKPEEFMYLVDHCHLNNIGVILDWVPAHFPKDEHGLNRFDGRQIYAYEGWKKGEHRDWGTLIFDYGKNEVKNFLISNALFWLDKYHIDGLRVDAVASMLYLDYSRKDGEWEPNAFGGRENLEAVDFLKQFNEVVHDRHPGIVTIAEESTAWPGVSRPTYLSGLGFSIKWNMGWMHDALEYFSKEPVFRKYHQGMLTFALLYAFSENFMLPISHDEVVYGKRSLLEKMPGDDWQKFANLRLFYAFMFAHPGKKLLFMGCDMAQRREWSVGQSLDWHLLHEEAHRQIQELVKSLNHLYQKIPAFYEQDFKSSGFEWIDFTDADASVLSFIRWSADHKECLIFAFNMTPIPRLGYRIGVPQKGFYDEILNTDAAEFGGTGMGNWGGVQTEDEQCHGRPFSIHLNLPPLGANIFHWKEGSKS